MFALPVPWQSVRREELHSPASSPRSSPDPAVEERLRSHIESQFTFTFTAAEPASSCAGNGPADDGAANDEEETELRLFAAPANAPQKTHTIRLLSPDAGDAAPGFLVKKPRSYYFAGPPTAAEEVALQAAAVEGKTVLERAKEPWPGCACPWKVRRISPAGLAKQVLVGHPPTLVTVDERARRRTRKNKKTRIAIRQKLQASKTKREEQAKLAQAREEAEREKRTRRNREKKVKKKAREKARKAPDGVEEGPVEQTEGRQEEPLQD